MSKWYEMPQKSQIMTRDALPAWASNVSQTTQGRYEIYERSEKK